MENDEQKKMENDEQKKSGPKMIERRRFLELSTKFGFTAAAVALFSGVLHSKEASAQVAKEEAKRQKTAKYKMNIATAYILGASRSYPIMQLDMKENIQNCTKVIPSCSWI
jgi:hypothetical protein